MANITQGNRVGLLCVIMQTSFMHPPFGFALFYLRGIAPRRSRARKSTGAPISWLFLQLILVAILIFWPEMVTMWIDHGPEVDPNSVIIELPTLEDFSAPPIPAPSQ